MTRTMTKRGFLPLAGALALAPWLGVAYSAAAQAPEALSAPQGPVILEIHGAITHTNHGKVAQYDRAMLDALPRRQLKTHTSVTDGAHAFDGFWVRDLLQQVGATGTIVTATALNDYIIDIPVAELDKYGVILAYAMDGQRLHVSDKGPLWIVYPRDDYPELQDIRYDYRWVWQVIRLDIS